MERRCHDENVPNQLPCCKSSLSFINSPNSPKYFNSSIPKTTPLPQSSFVITLTVRSVIILVTSLVFVYLAQVLGSPQKLYTWSSQGVHTSLALTSVKNQMPRLSLLRLVCLIEPPPSLHPNCLQDEPVHSTKMLTKSANVPTGMSLQRTMKPTAVCLKTIVLTTIVVKSQIFSSTIYRRDNGEKLTKPSSKYAMNKL
jgi:hypothetical protein